MSVNATSGNLMVVFDPHGSLNTGANLLQYYSGATLADGVSGGVTGSLSINPFGASSGKPVANYPYRVVSACVKVISLTPVTDVQGSITLCNWPEPGASFATRAWDDLRD